MTRQPFLLDPQAWLTAPREHSRPIDYACAVERTAGRGVIALFRTGMFWAALALAFVLPFLFIK